MLPDPNAAYFRSFEEGNPARVIKTLPACVLSWQMSSVIFYGFSYAAPGWLKHRKPKKQPVRR